MSCFERGVGELMTTCSGIIAKAARCLVGLSVSVYKSVFKLYSEFGLTAVVAERVRVAIGASESIGFL